MAVQQQVPVVIPAQQHGEGTGAHVEHKALERVLVIHQLAVIVAAAQQHMLQVGVCIHHIPGHLDAQGQTGAAEGQVPGVSVIRADLLLNVHAHRPADVLGKGFSGIENHVQLFRVEAGFVKQRAHGLQGHDAGLVLPGANVLSVNAHLVPQNLRADVYQDAQLLGGNGRFRQIQGIVYDSHFKIITQRDSLLKEKQIETKFSPNHAPTYMA
ncbi:hypothetical protein SDC9_145818 [bioreactor metagenome]|uniref:Uncharacterized protein n=1 Tax=bioreactor metagenome TaxID=1076179 RepID=A0A645EA06_9ZZZZ